MWYDRNDKFHLLLKGTRGVNATILGAVSNKKPDICYVTRKKSNSENMKDLVIKVLDWIDDPKNTIFVMD